MKLELTPNRFIGTGYRPYIMAEVGINHNGEFENAKLLIEEAAKTGADAVKFQKRTLNEMYTKVYLKTPYVKENSFGSTYGSHKEFLEFSDESVVDPDSSIEMMEIISSELQGLNSNDIKHFKEQIKEIANTYFDKKKEFVMRLPNYLGITDE